MLTKFETKSNRVKGLSFHPTRPWILSSLHSGSIQLWDFRMGTLLDRFEEHEGPVRGIHFHPSQNLFVSGGDDYKIKVWNYKLRRCIFTLLGHLDYIRTVYFHPDNPWIVSASDDQTVRIWNWQNRSCLAVLTGHNHYVMSACFHPAEDLVLSASLDQTVRVWDISSLRTREFAPSSMNIDPGMRISSMALSSTSKGGAAPSIQDIVKQVRGQLPASVNADLFGSPDGTVKYVLEGHSRGVNWACFHPTQPLIVSGSDDRMIKLWRMSDTKCWEVETFRGHLNNISCVMFHPHQDIIVSNSEDKTIRFWDLQKRNCIQTFRRDNDRFWILAVHPKINLIAAGHDAGMVVFKLARERPAFAAASDALVYVKGRAVHTLNYDNGRDETVASLKDPAAAAANPFGNMMSSPFAMYGAPGGADLGLGGGPGGGAAYTHPARAMSFNALEKCILLSYDTDGGMYELYQLPKGSSQGESMIEPRRGSSVASVFVGRNRFASLEKSTIVIRDLHNEVTKRVPAILNGADNLFPAASGYVLVSNREKVALLDLQQKKQVAEIPVALVKYVAWSDDNARVALLGKHVIVLASRRLEHLATVHETIRVKSAAWDESGVLVYSTLNHIKYCLPNGDAGIIATLKFPIYITRVRGPAVCYLDRDGNPGIMPIDPTEFTFKLLLLRKRYDDVRRLIAENRLCGQAIISYLQKKGFPEVALHFVKDERTRFELAVDSNAIDIAFEAAQVLDDPKAWRTLADVALKQGNLEIVELCYLRTKNIDKLAFLYVLTGNFEKLQKISKIAEGSGNLMARFQIAMYTGDAEGRAKTLAECGQTEVAKLCATSFGLTELEEELGGKCSAANDGGKLLLPPKPVATQMNWPTMQVSRGLFKRDPDAGVFEEPALDGELAGPDRDAVWDEEDSKPGAADPFAQGLDAGGDEGEGADGGWGDDFDIDTGAAGESAEKEDDFGEPNEFVENEDRGGYYVPPTAGSGQEQRWARNAKLAGELVVAGAFEDAMKLLQNQIGAGSFAPMKDAFMDLYACGKGALPCIQSFASNMVFFSVSGHPDRPAIIIKPAMLLERARASQQLVTQGKFSDALVGFIYVMSRIPLLAVETSKEVEEAKSLVNLARAYITGLKVELEQKRAKAEKQSGRQVQLAGLFTKCELAPVHIQLTLRAAMKTAYDTKNYLLAAGFARRLLESSPKPELANAAKKVIQFCDKNRTNEDDVDYDDRREFVVECGELKPLYAGEPKVTCPYCAAAYCPASDGTICAICSIGKVGANAEGLKVSWNQIR